LVFPLYFSRVRRKASYFAQQMTQRGDYTEEGKGRTNKLKKLRARNREAEWVMSPKGTGPVEKGKVLDGKRRL